MKVNSSVILMVTLSILNIVLIGMVCYYYSIQRWATGTIYFLISLSCVFFGLIGVVERKEAKINRKEGEELKVYSSEKEYNIPGFENYNPQYGRKTKEVRSVD